MLRIFKTYWPFIIGLLSGLGFFNFTITYPGFSHLPGDLGDTRFCNYLLEHAYLFFNGQLAHYWSAPFLYPEPNIISYSDNLLGTAPFYILFRCMGADREFAFQLWFILMTILNYTAAYFLLNYIFKNKYVSVLGAMIFTFSIALHSQMSHAQTFPRFAICLSFLWALIYLKELRPFYFFLSLLMLVYQIYCGVYLGLLLFVPLSLFFAISLVFRWKQYAVHFKQWKWCLMMISSIVISLLLLEPLVVPYLKHASETEAYSYEKVLQSVPTLKSFFYSHYGSLCWDFLKETGLQYASYWDHQIYAGGIAVFSFVLFSIASISRFFTKQSLVFLKSFDHMGILFLTAFLCFMFFIRFQGHSLYVFIYHIPGYSSLRALQRIINIELLFFAISSAYLFSYLFKSVNKWHPVLFLFCVYLVFADNHISNDSTDRVRKADSELRILSLQEKTKHLTKASLFSYEPDSIIGPVAYYQLDAMIVAQNLRLKTLNGYTAISPIEYSFYWNRPNEYGRMRWLKQKGISKVRIEIIH